MKRTISIVCTLILHSLGVCSAEQSSDELSPHFLSGDIHIPKGMVLFVGFDQGESGVFFQTESISVTERTNKLTSGVRAVKCASAESDLVLNVSAWTPPEPEEQYSWGKFKVELSWNNDREEIDESDNITTWYDGGKEATSFGWRLAGSFEYIEAEDANGKLQGLNQWCTHETPISMKMEKVDTNIKGLTYYRISCAFSKSGTKALVMFICNDIETLSKHIHVSGGLHPFTWDESHFHGVGKPVTEMETSEE